MSHHATGFPRESNISGTSTIALLQSYIFLHLRTMGDDGYIGPIDDNGDSHHATGFPCESNICGDDASVFDVTTSTIALLQSYIFLHLRTRGDGGYI